MKKITSLVIIFCCIIHFGYSQNYEYYNGKLIESNYIVLKYKPLLLKSGSISPTTNDAELKLQDYLLQIQATNPTQKFPKAYTPTSCKNCVDLTRVYDFYYTSSTPIEEVLTFLNRLPNIEYAEPNYVHQLLFIPDDTEIPSQWYMNTLGLFDAWDINQGDTNVVIGVVDAGFSITHNDLVNQIKYNYADPINGFDDDYDGFTDNFRGWDFANRDNNPDIGVSDHGTYVAGLASAEVNNGFAIGGTGYNCKFLPIKIATDDGYIIRGYEGIVYAANQGCDIINCSWGSVGSFTKYGEDVINYATFNMNALVIGAAGNSNNQGIFYPASFTNAFSIGGTINTDDKWGGSNYNYYVDICSPAGGYRSTSKNNSTTTMFGGTSFAAPIVSGVAALIKCEFPEYTALQIGEKLRTTATDIYGITNNIPYTHLLGSGRIDALSAITDTVKPSIRMTDFEATNRTGQYMFYTGDTLELSLTFKNYLASANNIFITVSCESSILAQIDCDTLIPIFGAGEEITLTVPFIFKIVSTLPPDIYTYFKITYNGTNYFGFEYFPISFNPSYYDFEIGNFNATATADGTIGILNPALKKENGIVYKDYPNMLYEGGLVLAQNANTFLKAANFLDHNDFTIVEFPTIIPSDSVDILISSKYRSSEMNLFVTQYIYGWADKDVLIHEYRITNETDSIIHNLYAGAYIDWQIVSQAYNKINYIDSLQFAHVSSIDPEGFYAGIMPLHYHQSNIYAIDDYFGMDSIYTTNGLTNTELLYALTHEKKQAGYFTYEGSTVSSISYSKIGEIKPDSTEIVRFAIIAGDNLNSINETAINLKQNYITDTTTHTNIGLQDILRNPIAVSNNNDIITINYPISNVSLQSSLFDIHGKLVSQNTIIPNSQTGNTSIHISKYPSGIYTLQVGCNNSMYSYKIVITK